VRVCVNGSGVTEISKMPSTEARQLSSEGQALAADGIHHADDSHTRRPHRHRLLTSIPWNLPHFRSPTHAAKNVRTSVP
jgi:hypothetical protein